MERRDLLYIFTLAIVISFAPSRAGSAPEKDGAARSSIDVIDDWQIRVSAGVAVADGTEVPIARSVVLIVTPATIVRARDEKYDRLPLFVPDAAPWVRGEKLRRLATFETTAADMLVPESVVLKPSPGEAAHFAAGKDYALEPRWATVGRLADGKIAEDTPVWIDYDCGWGRIDAIAVNREGTATIREGAPHNATPLPPDPAPGETIIAALWIPGRLKHLTADHIYPIVERRYHEPRREGEPPAVKLLPKAWAKLRDGKDLHVLAWGDSVTAGGQASDAEHQYQTRFVALLAKNFPRARIRLTTAGWGGRNSDSFLAEPPGAPFNFEKAVLAPRPDVVVMEFVNDAWMGPDVVETKYGYLRGRFQEIGAEWIIVTPHFVRPDWMGAPSVRVRNDPRPYVAGIRQFAAAHNVALADASLRWGHLIDEGIPYITLLSNSINHPDDRGHEIFAQALMELFR
jgi:hypothetical protein